MTASVVMLAGLLIAGALHLWAYRIERQSMPVAPVNRRRQWLARLLTLPVIGNIAVLRLNPGDVLVVECSEPIDDEGVACIRRDVENAFPGHLCVVMVDGLKLKVARERLTGGGEVGCHCLQPLNGSWADVGTDRVVLFYPFKGFTALKHCVSCAGTGRPRHNDKTLITTAAQISELRESGGTGKPNRSDPREPTTGRSSGQVTADTVGSNPTSLTICPECGNHNALHLRTCSRAFEAPSDDGGLQRRGL